MYEDEDIWTIEIGELAGGEIKTWVVHERIPCRPEQVGNVLQKSECIVERAEFETEKGEIFIKDLKEQGFKINNIVHS